MTDLLNLRKAPFIRLLLPFAAGIVFQVGLGEALSISILLIDAIFLALLLLFNLFPLNYSLTGVFGFNLSVILFLSGVLLTSFKQKVPDLPHEKTCYLKGIVVEPPVEKEKTFQVIVRAQRVSPVQNNKQNSSFKTLCYFEKDSAARALHCGQLVLFRINPDLPREAMNPGEFDYRKYLRRRDIFLQSYVPSHAWVSIKECSSLNLLAVASNIRERFLNLYRKYGIEGEPFQVAAALTLGDRDQLDEHLSQTYAMAGAMHILAVSGLHVGIIFLVFNYALAFLNRKKWQRIIKVIILLLVIWGFAFITGLAPSVKRAAIMFSFIIAGRIINQQPNIYNSLAGAAFLLLLINPFQLTQVAFQLSFIAVLSIVYFQPQIYALLPIRNKVMDKIWMLTTVSLAVQIGTAPISVFYFNQFPNYFLLTNLFAIPFAMGIVYTGCLFFVFSFWPWFVKGIAWLLSFQIQLLNVLLEWISNLPFAVSEDLFLSSFLLMLIFILIAFFIAWQNSRKVGFIYAILIHGIVLLIADISEQYKVHNQKGFVVYNVPGHTAIRFYKGKKNVLITDLNPQKDKMEINYYLKGDRLKRRLDKPEFYDLTGSLSCR